MTPFPSLRRAWLAQLTESPAAIHTDPALPTKFLARSLPIAGEGGVRVESSLARVAGSASFSEERSQGDPDPRGYHGRGGKRLALEPMGSKWPRKRDLQGVRRS